jgi:ATP-binding cassette subfamily B protein
LKLIFKYMKPFVFMALAAVALLFCQTILDLYLPNYMSKIVNVGIVQSGVEVSIPDVMDEASFRSVQTYASEGGARVLSESYEWVEAGKADADMVKKYPGLKDKGAYVLAETDKAKLADAKQAYEKAMYALYYAAGEQEYTSMTVAEFNQLAASIPSEAREDGKLEAAKVGSGMTESIAITFTKLFYKEYEAPLQQTQQSYILRIGGIMLLFSLMSGLADIGTNFFSARTSAGIGRKLRHDVYAKVTRFSSEDIDRFSTATLITRSTNDVQQVQMVTMMGIRMVFMAPIYCVGGIVMALRKSVSMSWIVALAVVLLMALQVLMFKLVVPKFQIMQKLTDKLNLVARESLTGMLVIRAFGNEKLEEKRFDEANKDITNTGLFVQRTMATLHPIENLILSGITLLIVWVGGHHVAGFKMPIGDMLAYMQYVMQIIMSFLMIAQMFIFIPRALVAATRISEILDAEPSIEEPEAPKSLGGRAKGHIEFRDVSFKYGDAEQCVLEHVNMDIQPGQTVAFIGSTGSGKSTLINLVPRFYDVTEGQILLDGIDIRELSLHELRQNIGYVPQKGLLFSGDVATNMSLGKATATDEEIYQAIRVAQAADFINPENNGLEIPIAQGGDNVSGGQKQRLSIARALLANPPIFIFDDSFSALDFRTDANLRKALYESTENATVLIVAQRVSTIMNADQILVLEEGRVVGHGTHKELLQTCEAYREIAESQLSKEELA